MFEEDYLEYQDSDDLRNVDASNIVVYSRDWTIDTILKQIELGNIDLNPSFQRRNAWNDEKRSKLIESIMMEYPIPEIVLAEDKQRKRSFIVIDGKQRLLTIAGFKEHAKYKYWRSPKLRDLKVLTNLQGFSYSELSKNPEYLRTFENGSLRCTVINNYNDEQVLYDIFYRLNAGSSPLATQELRQVLNRGPYADYLINITDSGDALVQRVMGLDKPDSRLRDVEVLLRLMAFLEYAPLYQGNLKNFLDDKMAQFNKRYSEHQSDIEALFDKIHNTIELLFFFFDNYQSIGRKYLEDSYERRFNRVLLEVEVFFFSFLLDNEKIKEKKDEFVAAFKNLCKDKDFKETLVTSTKNLENYRIRYTKFQNMVNEVFNLNLEVNPFKIDVMHEVTLR